VETLFEHSAKHFQAEKKGKNVRVGRVAGKTSETREGWWKLSQLFF
jgi:hypothetical protein